MSVLTSPSFLITYAVLQTVILLLLVRFIDLYEHEPLPAITAMAAWGAVGATALSYVGNEFVSGILSPETRAAFGPAISAPLVEEIAKGVALVAAFLLSAWAHRRYGFTRLGGLTDGLVYGAAVGIGFAFTEDLYYLIDLGGSSDEFLSRRDFFGVGALLHAMYAAATGAGLGLAVWTRSPWKRLTFGLTGLLVAMALHAVNNGLPSAYVAAQHGLEAAGLYAEFGRGALAPDAAATARTGAIVASLVTYAAFIAFAGAIAYWLHLQRRSIREELDEEVAGGLLDRRDVDLTPRFWARSLWYWELTRVGELDRAKLVRRLHIQLANLALLKRRARRDPRLGDTIAVARQRVATLKAGSDVDVYAPP